MQGMPRRRSPPTEFPVLFDPTVTQQNRHLGLAKCNIGIMFLQEA
jgi:hypothetical protein